MRGQSSGSFVSVLGTQNEAAGISSATPGKTTLQSKGKGPAKGKAAPKPPRVTMASLKTEMSAMEGRMAERFLGMEVRMGAKKPVGTPGDDDGSLGVKQEMLDDLKGFIGKTLTELLQSSSGQELQLGRDNTSDVEMTGGEGEGSASMEMEVDSTPMADQEDTDVLEGLDASQQEVTAMLMDDYVSKGHLTDDDDLFGDATFNAEGHTTLDTPLEGTTPAADEMGTPSKPPTQPAALRDTTKRLHVIRNPPTAPRAMRVQHEQRGSQSNNSTGWGRGFHPYPKPRNSTHGLHSRPRGGDSQYPQRQARKDSWHPPHRDNGWPKKSLLKQRVEVDEEKTAAGARDWLKKMMDGDGGEGSSSAGPSATSGSQPE
ncbi:hypothetical protein HMN09_01262200 [Mycena chlorophos]|uniref:Uncharacterized protein n=1 Tax=Mycena chlorophos TaxID=658473 RepID=A0A8H6VTU2_MYCCL|nr:hypothetical protein HMN09_01262200 [Mycena chlorophos]